jgi:hypothetical protein
MTENFVFSMVKYNKMYYNKNVARFSVALARD